MADVMAVFQNEALSCTAESIYHGTRRSSPIISIMKHSLLRIALGLSLLALLACGKDKSTNTVQPDANASDFYVLDFRTHWPRQGLTLIDLSSYQQTTEYTCGPAAVVSLLKHFGKTGDEMTIASEMGTSTTCGTNPGQMTAWLSSHGFTAAWHTEGNLDTIVNRLKQNIPVLVEWSDWGGHWVLACGYDTRNTPDLMDDVIIFADPYDRHDDHPDGFTWFNAQRFYYMWYDALLFGQVMKRIWIEAVPAGKSAGG